MLTPKDTDDSYLSVRRIEGTSDGEVDCYSDNCGAHFKQKKED